MKAALGILLSTMLLYGCSQQHTSYIDQTIDVVAGKDIVVRNNVLNIKKREGNSIAGIRMVSRESDGKETIITADTGMITQSPKQNVEPPTANAKEQGGLRVVLVQNSVKLTLFNANVQTTTQNGTTKSTVQKLEFNF